MGSVKPERPAQTLGAYRGWPQHFFSAMQCPVCNQRKAKCYWSDPQWQAWNPVTRGKDQWLRNCCRVCEQVTGQYYNQNGPTDGGTHELPIIEAQGPQGINARATTCQLPGSHQGQNAPSVPAARDNTCPACLGEAKLQEQIRQLRAEMQGQDELREHIRQLRAETSVLEARISNLESLLEEWQQDPADAWWRFPEEREETV